MIYLLTAIGLTPGGSSTVHIYTQTIRRTTQLTQTIHRTTQLNKTTQLTTVTIIIIIVTQTLVLSIFFNLTTDFFAQTTSSFLVRTSEVNLTFCV